jgi:hypothetical protein
VFSRCRQARPNGHKGLRQPIGERGKQERQSKNGQKHDCSVAAILVGLDGPSAATAANVATTANVTAMPMSIGNPLLTNGRSALANTNGNTGRMQGLTIVSTPPR